MRRFAISPSQRSVMDIKNNVVNIYKMIKNKEISLPPFSATSMLPSILNGGKDFSRWTEIDDLLYATIRVPLEAVLGKDGVGVADCAVAESKFEKGEDVSARMLHLVSHLSEIQQTGTPDMEFAVVGLLARNLVDMGRAEDAKRSMESVRKRFAENGNERFLPNMDAMLCRIELKKGNADSAEEWYRDKAPKDILKLNVLKRCQYFTQAMTEIARGDYPSVLLTLAQLEPYCDICHRYLDMLHLNVLKAAAKFKMNDEEWKVDFSAALDIAFEFNYIRPISGYGAVGLVLLDGCGWNKDEKYKEELLIAAKKAEAANEAKTEFLQRMSHDIRTPINGICGMVHMADYYADDMEKQTEYRTKVKEASNLLLELVNEILDMSKLESGEIVLEEIPFNLSSISREVLAVIEQMAAEQNIRIVWEKKEITHRDFIGSPGYVKRVMMNILSNAVKYNRENGHIYISCMEIPAGQPGMTTMEFVCRDTGIGMTEEFQKHIFEPFAQEHTGSRTKFAGTGLGMPIAKNLVEKMGGAITFESEEGTGTTFVIRVPFKIDMNADKCEKQKDVSEKSIKGLHILLAEDNELNMEIAEFVLQNEGAEVTKAWNGQEVVELFRKSEPGEFDVILMDIMMPVMNGYDATKKIRSLGREDAKVIPIIAMTANAFTEDRIRAKEAGMDEHVAKPVDVELLVKVIHKLVG